MSDRDEGDLVILVHGTFAGSDQGSGQGWWQIGSPFCKAMEARPDLDIRFPDERKVFRWTGKNLESARREAGRRLLEELDRLELADDPRHYHLIGHSHGGSVIWHALQESAGRRRKPLKWLKSWATVGTPFLHLGIRRKQLWSILLLAAYAVVGLIVLYWLNQVYKGYHSKMLEVIRQEVGAGLFDVSAVLLGLLWLIDIVLVLAFATRVGRLVRAAWTLNRDRAKARKAFRWYEGKWLNVWARSDEALNGLGHLVGLDEKFLMRVRFPRPWLFDRVLTILVLLPRWLWDHLGTIMRFLLQGLGRTIRKVRRLPAARAHGAGNRRAIPHSPQGSTAEASSGIEGSAGDGTGPARPAGSKKEREDPPWSLQSLFAPPADEFISDVLADLIHGNDLGGMTVVRISESPVRGRRFDPLHAEVENRLVAQVDEHSQGFVRGIRDILSKEGSLREIFRLFIGQGKALASEGLLHTRYFENGDVVDQLVRHIQQGSGSRSIAIAESARSGAAPRRPFRRAVGVIALLLPAPVIALVSYASLTPYTVEHQIDTILNRARREIRELEIQHVPPPGPFVLGDLTRHDGSNASLGRRAGDDSRLDVTSLRGAAIATAFEREPPDGNQALGESVTMASGKILADAEKRRKLGRLIRVLAASTSDPSHIESIESWLRVLLRGGKFDEARRKIEEFEDPHLRFNLMLELAREAREDGRAGIVVSALFGARGAALGMKDPTSRFVALTTLARLGNQSGSNGQEGVAAEEAVRAAGEALAESARAASPESLAGTKARSWVRGVASRLVNSIILRSPGRLEVLLHSAEAAIEAGRSWDPRGIVGVLPEAALAWIVSPERLLGPAMAARAAIEATSQEVRRDVDSILATAVAGFEGLVPALETAERAGLDFREVRPLIDQAVAAAGQIAEPSWRSLALAGLARATAPALIRAGRRQEAVDLVRLALDGARAIPEPGLRSETFQRAALAAAAAGLTDEARTAAGESLQAAVDAVAIATRWLSEWGEPPVSLPTLLAVAEMSARSLEAVISEAGWRAGPFDHALRRYQALASAVSTAVEVGLGVKDLRVALDRALAASARIADPHHRLEIYQILEEVSAGVGPQAREEARWIFHEANQIAARVGLSYARGIMYASPRLDESGGTSTVGTYQYPTAVVANGEPWLIDEAFRALERVEDLEFQSKGLAAMAYAAAEASRPGKAAAVKWRGLDTAPMSRDKRTPASTSTPDQCRATTRRASEEALRVAGTVESRVVRVEVRALVARAAAGVGDMALARRAASEALDEALELGDDSLRSAALARLVRAMAEARLGGALEIAQRIPDPYLKARSLALAARVEGAPEGRFSNILGVAAKIDDTWWRSDAFAHLAREAAAARYPDVAREAASRIPGSVYELRSEAAAAAANALAREGRFYEARVLCEKCLPRDMVGVYNTILTESRRRATTP